MSVVRVGIAGVGRWGAILARAFAQLEGCELARLCDTDTAARGRAAERFPAPVTDRFEDLLADPTLDAIALASPGRTHAALAERVLRAGKHCFVEKPLARSVADAERVLDAADEAERVLMVGHVLDYHPALARLKELIDDGELGAIHYIHTSRLNLSTPGGDENALWALGAHDVSVILALADAEPCEVEARGAGYRNDRIEEVVFAFLRFPSGLRAHMHCSWINPRKERRLTVVGSRRMATFDDMQRERKLTPYDHDVDPAAPDSYGEYTNRAGASWSPSTPNREPLATECQHFLDCIQHGRTPRTDGHSGLRVVRALEALQNRLDATRSPQPEPHDNAIGPTPPMPPATPSAALISERNRLAALPDHPVVEAAQRPARCRACVLAGAPLRPSRDRAPRCGQPSRVTRLAFNPARILPRPRAARRAAGGGVRGLDEASEGLASSGSLLGRWIICDEVLSFRRRWTHARPPANLIAGRARPSPRALELIAYALELEPTYFAEHRPAALRDQRDGRRVGFDGAYHHRYRKLIRAA